MKQGKNRYYRFSRISEAKFRQLIKLFSLDLTATNAARLANLSVRRVNDIYLKVRKRIAQYCEFKSPYSGEVEVDESYFGPKRIRGKRGRGAGNKTIVFGIFKRNGHVYTEIVPDASKTSLLKAIRGQVSLEAIVHSDGWRGYNGLVDMGYAKHLRVQHDKHEFANDKSHINGIESFWSFAKRRLTKFNGVPKHTFYLPLKGN